MSTINKGFNSLMLDLIYVAHDFLSFDKRMLILKNKEALYTNFVTMDTALNAQG
jgi:hypothetical protein